MASNRLSRDRDGEEKQNTWSSMLNGVASGKRLPEKNLLVLGGNGDSQKEFLETISARNNTIRPRDPKTRIPPLANDFALGYTYYDVLDADHEDVLARLSLYVLSDPSTAFIPLLKPLFTPQSIPNTLILILLDWTTPWSWMRQLRDWILLLRPLLSNLDEDCKTSMEDVMNGWRDRGRGNRSLDGSGSATVDGDVVLPLGPGEWEAALGLPLCVVCQNADKMETLERERAWKEEEFDFVLQFLRTTLLKHGASLIYTTPSVPSSLRSLVHSSLGIQSILKRHPLKPNVIDRDKVLVPPNWDSWGKIRVLREGFDVEGVNHGWEVDLQVDGTTDSPDGPAASTGALLIYEETIPDPTSSQSLNLDITARQESLDVKSQDPQLFLASQLDVLEKLRVESDHKSPKNKRDGLNRTISTTSESRHGDESASLDGTQINKHIGPIQFNMGGIQLDADDMLQRLKERQNQQTPDPESAGPGSPVPGVGGAASNEALASYFAGLMNRGGNTPNGSTPG